MSTYFKPAVKLPLQEIKDKIKDIEVIIKDDKQLFVLDNDCLHFDIDKKNKNREGLTPLSFSLIIL